MSEKKKSWPLFAKIIHHEDKNNPGKMKYSFILGPDTRYNKETKGYEVYGEDIFPFEVTKETRFFTKHMKPHFEMLVATGKMDKDAAEKKAKNQKFEIYIIPPDEDESEPKKPSGGPKTKKDEVDF